MPRTTRRPAAAPWHARQGDVLIVRVASIPAGAKRRQRENGRVILAHGEVTGHAHTIDDSPTAPRAEILDVGDLSYLRVDVVSQLIHEEHDTIELMPGSYQFLRQREYTPEAIRNVAD